MSEYLEEALDFYLGEIEGVEQGEEREVNSSLSPDSKPESKSPSYRHPSTTAENPLPYEPSTTSTELKLWGVEP